MVPLQAHNNFCSQNLELNINLLESKITNFRGIFKRDVNLKNMLKWTLECQHVDQWNDCIKPSKIYNIDDRTIIYSEKRIYYCFVLMLGQSWSFYHKGCFISFIVNQRKTTVFTKTTSSRIWSWHKRQDLSFLTKIQPTKIFYFWYIFSLSSPFLENCLNWVLV